MSGSWHRPHMATFIPVKSGHSEAREQPRWCRSKGCRGLPRRGGGPWRGQPPSALMQTPGPQTAHGPGPAPLWLSLAHWEHEGGGGRGRGPRSKKTHPDPHGHPCPPGGVPGSVCDLSPGSPYPGPVFLPSKPGEGMVWSHSRPSDLSSYKYHSRRLSARKPAHGTRLACQSACHSEH